MASIGSRHAARVIELTWRLSRRLDDEARLSAQNPVRLSKCLEPQPDLAVIQARATT